MDYELKIKHLEEELRHEQAMRLLQTGRMDTHDLHFEALDRIVGSTTKNLDAITIDLQALSADLQTLTTSQQLTQKMLQDLITLLTKPGGNGKH